MEANKMKKKKINDFLNEITNISKKYGIHLEATNDMFLTDDSGDIGSVKYDYDSKKYIHEYCF